MNGELEWCDAVSCFGPELDLHRVALSSAGWSTHGLLCCRFLADDTASVVSSDGDHAEQKLLRSRLWTEDLVKALASWDPRSSPMLVLLALNRSPCGDCAHTLASALHQLNDQFALTTERQHFVLASLGYYHSGKDTQRSPRNLPMTFSTDRGMRALKEAGWKLCTLNFGAGLTARGRQLNNYLSSLSRHG